MTLEKTTKPTMKAFLVFVITMLLLSGCVTKKKLKESQELQSTYILDQTEVKFTNSVQKLESNVTEKLNKVFDEKLKEVKESTTTNENESTTISGSITAEDGKEKTATIGNTTIKSNGANVTFKTTSTKYINKQLESINKELTQTITEYKESLKTIKNEFNEKIETQNKVIAELKAELEKVTKETDKKGLSFGSRLTMAIIIILAILFLIYRSKIVTIFKKFAI